MTTIDIDTTQAPPSLTIKDDRELCDIVYQIASKQLVINAAEANQQLKIEAAKKAFEEGTADFTKEIKTLFTAVQAYAENHKDRLFPVKSGTRKKTYSVMQHKLQYRSSDRVEAPSDAVTMLQANIEQSEANAANLGPGYAAEMAAVIAKMRGLIRTPAPELNKDAVKALSDCALKDHLSFIGIRVVTDEAFKLVFAFTPEQSAS
jgi:phage host-nuclease inhibitor protein Gam